MVSRGRLDQFHVPDLTAIDPSLLGDLGYLTRYLSEKYLLPVQAMSVSTLEWSDWSRDREPWKKLWSAYRSKKLTVYPEKPSFVAWLGLKRVLGF